MGAPPSDAAAATTTTMPAAAAPRVSQERGTGTRITEGKLFIGGLDDTITKEDLDAYASQWGEVADSVIMRSSGGGGGGGGQGHHHHGYAFLTFRDPRDAMRFVERRGDDGHSVKGRRLDVRAAMAKSLGGNTRMTRKLFIGGTKGLRQEEFSEHFAAFGDVEDCVLVHREGVSRGFGFVTFTEEVAVERCLLVNHYIGGKRVELKRAIPKEEMEAAAAAAAASGSGAGADEPSAGGGVASFDASDSGSAAAAAAAAGGGPYGSPAIGPLGAPVGMVPVPMAALPMAAFYPPHPHPHPYAAAALQQQFGQMALVGTRGGGVGGVGGAHGAPACYYAAPPMASHPHYHQHHQQQQYFAVAAPPYGAAAGAWATRQQQQQQYYYYQNQNQHQQQQQYQQPTAAAVDVMPANTATSGPGDAPLPGRRDRVPRDQRRRGTAAKASSPQALAASPPPTRRSPSPAAADGGGDE